MKKIIIVLLTIFFYFFLISFSIFTFSYLSLLYGKTYDIFWVNSIQKKIYFRGLRNIFQYDQNCVKFDKDLLYVPKDGLCNFKNFEFDTTLTFRERSRINKNQVKFRNNEKIVVLGDSIGMGWGVNDQETFSSILERRINKEVKNLSVSSYGTVRELKSLFKTANYKDFDTIIIQYNDNDITENKYLDIEKTYSKKEYRDKILKEKDINNLNFILRNFKSTFRLFFTDLRKVLFEEKSKLKIDFNEHKKYIDKLILNNEKIKNKKILIIFLEGPHMKILNFPRSDKIDYLNIRLEKKHYFKKY